MIQREGIECYWRMNGRFSGAYTPHHYKEQAAKVGTYNASAGLGTYMVPREQQREEIASDYYYGGMVVERTGQLHPALYYGGLLKATHSAGAKLCAQCDAEKIERKPGGFRVLTSKGPIEAREVVIATNGYTTELTPTLEAPAGARRQPHHRDRGAAGGPGPEPDPEEPRGERYQAGALLLPPVARQQAGDLRRPRALHPGDARGERAGAARLYAGALAAVEGRQGHPCLDRQRRLRLRLPAAHGHGAGHALPDGLQRLGRGDDELSRLPDRAQDRRRLECADQCVRRPALSRPCRSTTATPNGSCRWSAPGIAPATGGTA